MKEKKKEHYLLLLYEECATNVLLDEKVERKSNQTQC